VGADSNINLTFSNSRFVTFQVALVSGVLISGTVCYAIQTFSGHRSLLGFLHLFDVGNEQSFATYLSTMLLLLAAALLYVAYRAVKQLGVGQHRYWLLLCWLFVYLSIDEAASIHENFGKVYEYLVRADVLPRMLDSHEWLPFGVLFVLVTGGVFLPFLFKLRRDTAALMCLAGTIFVSGAIGFEFLGAVMLKTGMVASNREFLYLLRRIAEEGLEMFGVVLFNWTVYREILRHRISVTLVGADIAPVTTTVVTAIQPLTAANQAQQEIPVIASMEAS